MKRLSLDERLWDRVDFHSSGTGCWLWQGAVGRGGYGRLRAHGENYAHRVAYREVVGDIPKEMTLDHLCRSANCVNPDHLEPVSIVANILRGNGVAALNARKTHCKRGHEFTPENTYYVRGGRSCRECQKAHNLRYYYRVGASRRARKRASPGPFLEQR